MSSPFPPPVSPLLAALHEQLAGEGLRIAPVTIFINPSDELVLLRQQNDALQAENTRLLAERNRTEYLFRCECIINTRILDYCREAGFKIPKKLLRNIEE